MYELFWKYKISNPFITLTACAFELLSKRVFIVRREFTYIPFGIYISLFKSIDFTSNP